MSYRKTAVFIEDANNGILDKMWIVGDDDCLNFVTMADDPINHNESHTGRGWYETPKYFDDYNEARACAKYWNETVKTGWNKELTVRRHGGAKAYKPHLVKITLA